MANFMRAYTIAFETSNGEQVASRAIIPFFKKIQEILKDSPQNVIRRINGKIMRVHAYEWIIWLFQLVNSKKKINHLEVIPRRKN